MSDSPPAARPLVEMQPSRSFFVGIDSDGCAFDSMEIKHKECFCPNTIKFWRLQAVSKYAREAWEFVNLYSRWRGINRWPALITTLDRLRERPEVRARRVEVPEVPKLRAFVASGRPLSNEGLKAYASEYPDPELERALAWSNAVNASVKDIVQGVPPFPFVWESLQRLQAVADVVVVSATPGEALVREWEEHDLARYARVIAGQEMGTKRQHLALATKGRYAPGHVLMVGDAPGDRDAARANGAFFFPINPGHEERSWQILFEEGLGRFLSGRFAGDYEAALEAEFEALLPETPPWKR